MKQLPKCSIDTHAFLAHERYLKKKEKEEAAQKKNASLNEVLADVAQAFQVHMDLIKSSDQQSLVVTVRKIFYYIGRTKYGATYDSMVKMAGKNSHKSCIYHIHRIQQWLTKNDAEFIPIWNHYLENSKLYTKKDFQ